LSDAIETQKAMLNYPISPSDQRFSCEQVHMKRIGYCLANCKPEEIRRGIKFLEENNFGKEQLAILKDIFEEKKHSS